LIDKGLKLLLPLHYQWKFKERRKEIPQRDEQDELEIG